MLWCLIKHRDKFKLSVKWCSTSVDYIGGKKWFINAVFDDTASKNRTEWWKTGVFLQLPRNTHVLLTTVESQEVTSHRNPTRTVSKYETE